MQATPHGFSAVYRREFPFVWAAARRFGVHPAALDDAVQDVFVTAYRRWDDLDVDVSPRAWLYGVTRRVAFRYRRSEARTARRKSAVSQVRRRHEPHAHLEGAHDVEAVLAQLPDGRREVFVMSELLDMSGPEIAAELQIPLNTVYSRLRLARRQLERSLTRKSAGAWVRAARRQDRPPSGQARRSWAVIVPLLRTRAPLGLGLGGGASSVPVMGVVAGVIGALAITGWLIGAPERDGSAQGTPIGGRSARTAAVVTAATPEPPSAGVAHASAPRTEGVVPPEHPVLARTPERIAVEPVESSRSRARSARASDASSSGAVAPLVVAPAVVEPEAPTPIPVSPSPSSSPSSPSSSLADEVVLLDRAAAALRADKPAQALRWLAQHAERFPRGRLTDVRGATRVRALCRLGRTEQAQREATSLRAAYPHSTVAQRVPVTCAGSTAEGGSQ